MVQRAVDAETAAATLAPEDLTITRAALEAPSATAPAFSPSPAAAGEGRGGGRSAPPTPPATPGIPSIPSIPSTSATPGATRGVLDLAITREPALAPPAALTETFHPPVRIAGYRLLRILGSGGMGIVYEAEHVTLGRRVALKILTPGHARDPKALERFQREARAAALLTHPGIVSVFEIGDERGLHFYAMERVEGTTLDARVAHGRLPPREAAELAAQAADALAYAHGRGIVHRDIKPGNLILTPGGRVKLMDFGIAKEHDAATLTAPGVMMGTPAYMSPEQAEGSGENLTPLSDVYSLGATLYELATGHRPFAGTSIDAILAKIFTAEPAPARTLAPDVPRDLEVIVQKAMAKDPGLRYASAAALAEDLRRFLAGEPIAARQITYVGRLARRLRRNLFFWVLIALMTVVSGASVFFAAATLREQAAGEERRAVEREHERARALRREEARRKVQEGVFLKTSGTTLALAKFEEALALDRDFFEAWLERARCYKEQARYEEALADLGTAIRLEPRATEAYVERIKIAICRRDYVKALVDIPMIARLSPGHPYLECARGTTAWMQGDRVKALAEFNAGVGRNPKSAIMYAFRAGLRLTDADPRDRAEGIADLDRALALEPANAVALNFLAIRHLQERNFKAAQDAALRALTSDKVFPEAYVSLGKSYFGLGNLEAALAQLDEAVRYGPNYPDAYEARGVTRLRFGKNAGALADGERLLAVGGDRELGLYLRTVALARLGRFPEAQALSAQHARELPDSVMAAMARADLLLEQDRLDEALATAQQVLERKPGSAQALALRGRVRQARGESVNARDDLERAVRQDATLFYEIQATITARGQRGARKAAAPPQGAEGAQGERRDR
ncbi:MAG: protein kinase [Planctomycetes bacterium]|nr:protein kinase [Planctomycetota bacterium]